MKQPTTLPPPKSSGYRNLEAVPPVDGASVDIPSADVSRLGTPLGGSTSRFRPTLVEPQDDDELIARARANDSIAFELLMRRHNQRVYRVVRSVLKNASETEDVIQQAYLQAFVHLDQFDGAARWSTWVCRIAINLAMARLRHQGKFVSMDTADEVAMAKRIKAPNDDPESQTSGRELGQMIELAIDRLPEIYRAVVIMREVEGMSTAETAQVLAVEPEVVKTRLHRARVLLRVSVEHLFGEEVKNAFAFGNERCDRVVTEVLSRLKHGQ